ncbi:uncharacterized protein LOC107882805 [Acyrthosiphon pisum]|uniref:THAP-type domain-containing protein n=1 Tax=Acyrthosiphon pisum TaxID=7029 RepID=A0A8R2NUL5_ACYPI|nr:uncharacterized protein LOC107882805 [Acyrthosiphon pisum]
MPRKCVICNVYDRNSDQSFYSFPKDEGRKKLWLKACGIGLYLPSYRVCEAHFSNEDFLPNGYLTSIAIPVNIKSKQPELLESANTVFESTSQETLSPEKITIVSTNSICITPKKRCSSVLPDVSSSQKRKRFNPDTIGDLSPSHFNTPRKAKKNLEMVKYKFSQKQTQNVNLKKQVKRLQTKLKTYDDLILQLKSKNFISENASVHLKSIGSESLRSLIERNMKGQKLPYSSELRKFAITLQFYSTKAYQYVRKSFNNVLPHPRSISRWYKVVNGDPGFTDEAFKCIENKAKNETVICNIVLDEMSIREQTDWDGTKMHGFVDMGTNVETEDDNAVHAKNAFVFMAVGINGHWKMPIGYFLVAGLNGSERSNLLEQCLNLMSETGAKVHSVTFDGAYTNATMCSKLGASFDINDDSSFCIQNPFNNEPIFIFYDACHMLKLVRNTLGDMKYMYNQNGLEISSDHIKALHFKEKEEGLRAATKLSNKHIYYHNEKMNVKLAAQVLSNSVGSALKFCKSLGDPNFKNVDPTAEFCFMINNAFDILNCRTMYSKNPFCLALDSKVYQKYADFIVKFKEYILGLKLANGKRVVDSGRKTGFIGLISALSNLLKLYTYLSTTYSLSYMLSYKLSQDHIETFFSSIRQRGGFNNNPSCKQFKSAYKKLLVHNEISGSQYGNCISILDTTQMSVVKIGPDSIISDDSEQNINITDHDYFRAIHRITPFLDEVTNRNYQPDLKVLDLKDKLILDFLSVRFPSADCNRV